MRLSPHLLALALAASPLAGCAMERAVVRTPQNVPDHFLVAEGATTREPRAGEGCHSPMQDPRDGTRLTLDRSANGVGDYVVPQNRYGTSARTRLRLDCATGRPVGVVAR